MNDQSIQALVLPIIHGQGMDLEGLSLRQAGKRHILQIVVDRENGVDLDQVADLSRTISETLDQHPHLLPSNTVLEVSSPGVDRPLTEERHWRRATGRLVDVTPRTEPAFTDRITDVADGVVTFASGRTIAIDALDRGLVHVEFTGGSDGH